MNVFIYLFFFLVFFLFPFSFRFFRFYEPRRKSLVCLVSLRFPNERWMILDTESCNDFKRFGTINRRIPRWERKVRFFRASEFSSLFFLFLLLLLLLFLIFTCYLHRKIIERARNVRLLSSWKLISTTCLQSLFHSFVLMHFFIKSRNNVTSFRHCFQRQFTFSYSPSSFSHLFSPS